MSPNFRRYLPFMVGALALLIIISAFTHRTTSATSSAKTVSTATQETLSRVERAEALYEAAHHAYTPHVADLLVESHALGEDLAEGITVQLDVSSDSQAYYALVQSSVLSEVSAWHDGKRVTQDCVVVKSGNGVSCPSTSSSTSGAKTKTT
jgi:hypothetical protein